MEKVFITVLLGALAFGLVSGFWLPAVVGLVVTVVAAEIGSAARRR